MQQHQERVLYSPKENVSEQHIVLLEDAITRIKELVIKGGSQQQIQTIIEEYANKFVDKATQQAIRRSLTNSANKMMYQYNYNNNVIQQAFIQKTVKSLRLGTGTNLSNKTYTTDLNAIYNEYLTGNISQHKCVEEFRNTLNNAKKGLFLMRDYDKLVRQQVDLLASEPAKYVDKNGKAISLRNKVEMSVRYQANLADVANMKNEGVKLVWISSHADASPRCRDHQGKLYSLDDTSGTIDGISYTPLQDVLRKNGGNSIINGYNCRHYLIEYKKGSKSPTSYNEKEIKKEYEIDQKQRNYENRIRHLKTKEALYKASGDDTRAKAYRRQYIELNQEYKNYSISKGRAYYEWRTRISTDEKQQVYSTQKQYQKLDLNKS
jgi:hypothetical protein